MTRRRDMDEILRRMAAQDQVMGFDSRGRWARLHQMAHDATRGRRRARQRTLVLATSLGVLLIGLAMWRDVGTEDFVLVPGPAGAHGERVFSARHRPYAWSTVFDTLGNQELGQLGEELLSRTEAGEGRLTSLFGTTIGGKTHFIAIGEVQTTVGPRTTNLNLQVPLEDAPTEASMAALGRFTRTRLDDTRHAIAAGQAHALEPIELTVAGLVIRCERWQLFYPEFGLVVYWDGKLQP